MPDILYLARIRASPDAVYRALATPEGVRNWWTRDATLDEHVGGTGEFAFYNRKTVTTVRIDALEPGVRVAWTTLTSGAPGGWEGSTIAFDIRSDGDGTVVAFAHRGLARADEGFARVTMGWSYYLASLQQYLETGAGAPHPDTGVMRIVSGA